MLALNLNTASAKLPSTRNNNKQHQVIPANSTKLFQFTTKMEKKTDWIYFLIIE